LSVLSAAAAADASSNLFPEEDCGKKKKSWRDDKFLIEGMHKEMRPDGNGFNVDDDGFVHVYTDGACSDNGKGSLSKAGIGVWWSDDHPLNLSEPVEGDKVSFYEIQK
jgi:hypothetical protein